MRQKNKLPSNKLNLLLLVIFAIAIKFPLLANTQPDFSRSPIIDIKKNKNGKNNSLDNDSIEKILADIPFRSYRNIANSETQQILEKINKNPQINMTKESWEDIVINSRSKFEKNSDWHLIIKTLFEKVNNNLQARRDFLHALEKLETKNRDAANELRDYLRTAKLIDIVK